MKKNIITLFAACFVFLNLQAQHTLLLKSGEKMNGKVVSLTNGVITFDFKGNNMKFNVTEVKSILFEEGGSTAPAHVSGTVTGEPGEKSVTANNAVVRYKVADRTITKPPMINNLTQEKGTVVVSITVDKYGHVRKATPGAEGSTTKSEYLLTKAKQAAESALFNNVPNAPLEQNGYMVIVF